MTNREHAEACQGQFQMHSTAVTYHSCQPVWITRMKPVPWNVSQQRQCEIWRVRWSWDAGQKPRSGLQLNAQTARVSCSHGLLLKCFFTVLDVHHDGAVTVVLLTKPRLCAGCVYFKISSNYLTMPSRYASQRKNAVCIFGVNADSYSQNTKEES